ncbi:MAG: serine/threonine protein phosphatase [Spirochaetota bacterium]|nr:MAG: serine/threonine protein phosphatase [Spirochaetota bacterium]
MEIIKESDYRRIIAIGDLHGYCAPMKRLLEKIDLSKEDLLIFMGDYVDRGPESSKVIDTLLELCSKWQNLLFLKGNHEDMMLGSLGHPASVNDLNTWMYNGGGWTLKSYGMGPDNMRELGNGWRSEKQRRVINSHIPESHIDFLLDLKLYIETENYFFCHGGIDPDVSIEQGRHNAFDLLWMRDHIYAENYAWEKTVVCGHTPLHDVLIRDRLICIDTGLYYYGKLSAIDVLGQKIFSARR